MQIKLSNSGPAMWFLGEPKNLTAYLNFANPGPVEIKFEDLGSIDQNKILTDLKQGIIESDISYQELYQVWIKSKPAVPHFPPEDKELSKMQEVQKMRYKLETQRREKEEKFQERCYFIADKGVRAIKAVLKDEKDIRFFRELLKIEKVGKNRKIVISLLNDKVKQFEKNISKKIRRGSKKQSNSKILSQETIVFDVVESEQETITLTPEDLISAAAGELM